MIEPLQDSYCANDDIKFKNGKDVIINVPERDDPQVFAVLVIAAINPYVSIRQIKRELGTRNSQST
jgi:hypothetical protein